MASMPVDTLLWVEKYRPRKLEDVALEPDTRAMLQGYLDAGEIPHLLLVGPPGSGKTTVARILYRGIDCSHIVLNASSERGIDVVRNRIGSFVTAVTVRNWNVVFLDEADAMTSDAQTAMRNLIESYADRARFILTANYLHKIIGPIQSRCQVITLGAPPLRERFAVLTRILAAEGVEAVEPRTVLGYAEKFPDMRKMIQATQRGLLISKGTLPPAVAEERVSGEDLLRMIDAKDWTGLRRVSTSASFDHAQGLRDLFWAVPDDHPRSAQLRHIVGRGVHETGFTPDPVVLFLSVCAEILP